MNTLTLTLTRTLFGCDSVRKTEHSFLYPTLTLTDVRVKKDYLTLTRE